VSHFILIHGFNDPSAGEKNIDKLAPPLVKLGHTVEKDTADYGRIRLLWVRLRKHSAVLRILEAIKAALDNDQDVIIVAYSNGANYAFKALRLVFLGLVRIVLVHPALRSKARIPDSVSRGWVAFTRSDWTVRLASYVRWIVPGWGRMGYRGYRGTDPRIESIDYTSIAKGHGGLFKDKVVQYYAGELDRLARLQ
jgi:hypothetical protein